MRQKIASTNALTHEKDTILPVKLQWNYSRVAVCSMSWHASKRGRLIYYSKGPPCAGMA
jgi:hypothetical protein